MNDDRYAACLSALKQVFGVAVNADEAFFDLGGDSLHAIELVMLLRNVAGLQVHAFDMVNAPSLSAFFRSQCQEALAGVDGRASSSS